MLKIKQIKEIILDILFPPICLNCQNHLAEGEKSDGLCAACFSKITVHTTLFCPVCRARLPENKKICHRDSSYLLAAATNYDEVVRNLIHQFKYQSWGRLQAPIKKILELYLQNLLETGFPRGSALSPRESASSPRKSAYVVVPIPLHKKRERERGFNQAELIGKIIADYLNLPLEKNLLTREKETKSQVDLKDWDQRKNNLADAFKIANPESARGKNIILVDDVYTSGATINEAVATLRAAGARKIIAFVIAKTR